MITLTSTEHINASTEQVWHFLTHLHEKDSYQEWHPVDHIVWRHLSGNSEKAGSTYHFAEMISGKKLESGFRLNKATRLKYLEYGATGLLEPLRIVTATFEVKEIDKNKTELVAKVFIGYNLPIISRIVDWVARMSYNMEAITKHMKEEGYYLNKALSK